MSTQERERARSLIDVLDRGEEIGRTFTYSTRDGRTQVYDPSDPDRPAWEAAPEKQTWSREEDTSP